MSKPKFSKVTIDAASFGESPAPEKKAWQKPVKTTSDEPAAAPPTITPVAPATATEAPTGRNGSRLDLPEASPCLTCGTTRGWSSNGHYIRIRGCCEKCYIAGKKDGSLPPSSRPSSNGTGNHRKANGFVEVGTQIVNLANVAHVMFSPAGINDDGEPFPCSLTVAFIQTAEDIAFEGDEARNLYDAIRSGAVQIMPPSLAP